MMMSPHGRRGGNQGKEAHFRVNLLWHKPIVMSILLPISTKRITNPLCTNQACYVDPWGSSFALAGLPLPVPLQSNH